MGLDGEGGGKGCVGVRVSVRTYGSTGAIPRGIFDGKRPQRRMCFSLFFLGRFRSKSLWASAGLPLWASAVH